MVGVIRFLLGIIEAVFTGIIEFIFSIAGSSDNRKAEYSASFAPVGSVMSLFNQGFALAGGLKATTKEIATRSSLVVGQSGSGKSSCVLWTTAWSIIQGGSSMCILDIGGVLREQLSGYAHSKTYRVYTIDFTDFSDCLNILDLCKDRTDIMKVALLLIKCSKIESSGDNYWIVSSESMLVIFIEYVLTYTSPEYRNMSTIVRLTNIFAADPTRIDALFTQTMDSDLITRYMAMNSVGDKVLASTLSTVRQAIKCFGTPSIAKCTSHSTIDLSSFRHTSSILFISIPINDIAYLSPVSSLVFDAIFQEILSRIPHKSEKHIFCLLDEMVQQAYSNLGAVYSLARKHLAGCMGVVQDERMLEMRFSAPEAHAIRTNSYSKVYLPGQPLQTCKQLEEILGKYTYTDSKGIERHRLLLSAAEIRMIENKAILLVGNKAPVLAKLRPFYSHWWLKKYAKYPPYKSNNPQLTEPPKIPV